MNTSLLFYAFGAQGLVVTKTEYKNSKIYVFAYTNSDKLRCPCCHSKDIIRRGTVQRELRGVPIGSKEVKLHLTIQRLFCKRCYTLRQEHLPFAKERRRYTRAFERHVIDLCRIATLEDVSNHLNVSWDTVKDIQKRYMKSRYQYPDITGVRRIGIDEFAVRKGHKYMTVVACLDTGRILWVGDGKGGDALKGFWKRYKKHLPKIQAVSTDMSPAFVSAVSTNLPNASLVVDHFHVIKLFNTTLDEIRRDLFRMEKDLNKRSVIKGLRWLLLRNTESLTDERDEKSRLQKALDINKPLAEAYLLKEDLRQLWMQKDRATAELYLVSWVKRAWATKTTKLVKFGNTILAFRNMILNYYDHPISTGKLEGINNKIKTMKRQAYGFRDMEFFKLKIYALHDKKYALVG